MHEVDKRRSLEFAQFVLGKSVKKPDVDFIVDACDTFAEFRIAVFLKSKNPNDLTMKITARWRESIQKLPASSDGNDLMHTAELLALKQLEIEQKLRESTAEMLDKLKALDSLATLQVDIRAKLADVSELISQFRKQMSQVEHDAIVDRKVLT